MKLLLITLLFLSSSLSSSAREIQLAVGRIAVLDLGSIIRSKLQIANPELINAYTVSGIDDENSHSIIVLQGLKDNGETDLIVNTSYGLEQFKVVLNKNITEDYCLAPNNTRLRTISSPIKLNPQRSSIIKLSRHINKFILASDPSLIKADELLDYYDENYLKTISIISAAHEGIADLIIPSKAGVYKLTLEIDKEAIHEAIINLP